MKFKGFVFNSVKGWKYLCENVSRFCCDPPNNLNQCRAHPEVDVQTLRSICSEKNSNTSQGDEHRERFFFFLIAKMSFILPSSAFTEERLVILFQVTRIMIYRTKEERKGGI